MPKPILWGDKTFDAERIEEYRRLERNWDRSYVPGYSEIRRDNEIRVKEGDKPIPHDRLQWVRVSRTGGNDVDHKDLLEWGMLGYQFCTEDDLLERGWKMPPTAHVAADGTIRREDLALAIVDKETARLNKEYQEQKTRDARQGLSSSNPEIEVVEELEDANRDPLELLRYLDTD